jgi:hypothetical protein
MAVKRYGVQNPSANTETTLLTTNDPLLISVIVTNKHASADADIRVFVIPNGATNSSQYAYIAYDLQLNPGNSVETHRFAVNAGDTVKVSSSISDVSFSAAGIPQTDILPADETQVFTNKTISGLNNTLTNIGNSSLTNSQITLMGEQMDLGETVANLDYFQFDTAATVTPAAGRMWWNSSEGTVDLRFSSDVTYQMGMQLFMPPTKNNSGVEIPAGSFVMATGVQGDRITIAKAVTNGTVDAEYMIGIAADTIAVGSEVGKIITQGTVFGINTQAWPVGTLLYPNPSVSGGLTSTRPDAPNIKTPIAIVLRQQQNTGRILVRMDIASELGGTDTNVLISSPLDGQALTYESSTGLWKNTSIDALPSQTGNSGKYLTTNGTAASWGDISGAVYSDTAPSSPTVGQLWIESDVDISAYSIYQRWTRNATGSETTFTGTESGITLSYPVGLEHVYLNGVLLVRGSDYTASNGTSVVLTSAAQVGDVIEILSPNTFDVANTYTISQIDSALALKADSATINSNIEEQEILNIMGALA